MNLLFTVACCVYCDLIDSVKGIDYKSPFCKELIGRNKSICNVNAVFLYQSRFQKSWDMF